MGIPISEESKRQKKQLSNQQLSIDSMQINRQGAKKRRNENELIVSLIFESQFKIGIISIDTQLNTKVL
jgi:hypothetical protein